jgi:hypothetical protein
VRKHPEIWESRYRESVADDTLVRMVDDAPKTDGVREAVYDKSTPIKDGKTTLHLLSNMKTLHLFVESEADEVTLSLATALPPKHYRGNKPSGTVTIARDGTVTAGNAAGEDLLHVAAFQKGTPWKAEIRIPYTHVPAQAIWISGIDHGRYEVTLGETKKMVYLLSEPARLIRRLEEQALQSLETWWPIYQKVGAIPLSWRAATRTDEHREVPDLGNNAFFVKLMSVILIDRAGTSEWELMRKNAPKEPLPSSLPDSVIKAQGLEPK